MIKEMIDREYQICSNCVMDTTAPKIIFDQNGICEYCINYEKNILPNWHPNELGNKLFDSITVVFSFTFVCVLMGPISIFILSHKCCCFFCLF